LSGVDEGTVSVVDNAVQDAVATLPVEEGLVAVGAVVVEVTEVQLHVLREGNEVLHHVVLLRCILREDVPEGLHLVSVAEDVVEAAAVLVLTDEFHELFSLKSGSFSCWHHCTMIQLAGVKPCQLFVSLGEQPSELLVRLVQLLLRDAGPAVLGDVSLVDLAREQALVRPEPHATVGPLKGTAAVRVRVREVILEPVVIRQADRLNDAQHLLRQLVSERLRGGSGGLGLLALGEDAEHDVLLEMVREAVPP
jgi:hypothetical protein